MVSKNWKTQGCKWLQLLSPIRKTKILILGQIFLTTKFGNHVTPEGGREIRNDAEYIRQSVADSLKKLQTNYIDLLYWSVISTCHGIKPWDTLTNERCSHRFNGQIPVEDIITVMKEFVEYGHPSFPPFQKFADIGASLPQKVLARSNI